ncbi:hypothetical protein [Muricoccus aerilatus]|uniref:hypothetical protein n=1 Tax=Muricoccus aerilatus TaxID=452982 RepID=UPI0012EBFAD8|nr:hypothetical protein [Roseomonas aerilata]
MSNIDHRRAVKATKVRLLALALAAIAPASLRPAPAAAFSVSEAVRAFYDLANPWGIALSPDGQQVAISVLTGEDQRRVVEWAQRRRIGVFAAEDGTGRRDVGPVFASSGPFAFSPDGRRLVSVRFCLTEAECATHDPNRGTFFVETDLESGEERVLHRTLLGAVRSIAYDALEPRRVLFSADGLQKDGSPNLLASFEQPSDPAAPPREAVLLRWGRADGYIWRILGGSAERRVLFSGDSFDDTIPGLREEARALPSGDNLGTLRLFAWDVEAGGTPARVVTVPLAPREGPAPRFALPLAATPDGSRVLLAATVPGRPNIAYGPGNGSFGLSTDLYLLEAGRAARLTRLCGIVRQAAITPDGRRAAAIAGAAVTRGRGYTPTELYGLDVDAAAASAGILPHPTGILAREWGTDPSIVEAAATEAACSSTWPDPPPGRTSAADLLQRVAALAERHSIADPAVVEAALAVRLQPVPESSGNETRYRVVGEDLAYGEAGHAFPASEYRVRQSGGSAPFREMTIGLARTGPCVTLSDVVDVLGPDYRDERPRGGGISFLHHMHPRPVGAGRSEVDTAVYERGTATTTFRIGIRFGLERCADLITLSESARFDSPALRSPAALACRAAPSVACLADVAAAAAAESASEAALGAIARGLAGAGRITEAQAIAERLPNRWAQGEARGRIALLEIAAAARERPDVLADLAPLEATAAAAEFPASDRLSLYFRLSRHLLGLEDLEPDGTFLVGPYAGALRNDRIAYATVDELLTRWRAAIQELPAVSAEPRQPTRSGALRSLAPVLFARGDLAGAAEAVEAAIDVGRLQPNLIAEAWAEIGDVARATAAEEALPQPRASSFWTLARTMRQVGEPPEAILPVLRRAIALGSPMLREVIRLVADLGDLAAARTLAAEAAARARAAPRIRRAALTAEATLLYLDLGDREMARTLAEDAAANLPDGLPMPSSLAVAFFRLGEQQRFVAALPLIDRTDRANVWYALVRDPSLEQDASVVAGADAWLRPHLLAEIALRRIAEGRGGEVPALVRAIIAGERIGRDERGPLLGVNAVLAGAARLAQAVDDRALAAEALRLMAGAAFDAEHLAPQNLAAVASFWRRRMPDIGR